MSPVAAVRALILRVGQPPETKTIDGSLEGLQKIVGGYIELVTIEPGVVAVMNEDGRMLGLPVNRIVARTDGRCYDLVGDVVLVGVDADGATASLSEDDAQAYMALYGRAMAEA